MTIDERTSAIPLTPFDDVDILEIATAFGITLDNERIAIARNLETVDVRACPGSGKTTLLVAKLALLISHWNNRYRGICVLSHTNVAKHEILRRFPQFPALLGLNSYPHFVGTLQSFIDQFFGIPGAVQQFGRRPQVIDDDRYGVEIRKEFFGTPAYGKAQAALRKWLNANPQKTPADVISDLHYADSSLSLPRQGPASKPWSDASNAMKELVRLKDEMSRRGFFRFCDMIALAERYVARFPVVTRLVAHRFPIVLIDEMQDTPARHSKFIDTVFGGSNIIQRIGDDRQSIFSEASGDVPLRPFPLAGYLTMPQSFRLSPKVATLAQSVCVGEREQLRGNPERRDGRHTIFLFSKLAIGRVLPEFADLVAEDVGVNFPAHDVRAVGATTKLQADEKKFPSGLGDYWADYDPPREIGRRRIASLTGYLELARHALIAKRSCADARRQIVEAAVRLLKTQLVSNPPCELHYRNFLPSLRVHRPHDAARLERVFATLCSALLSGSSGRVDIARDSFVESLQALAGAPWSAAAKQFIETQSPPAVVGRPSANAVHDNVFRHNRPEGVVNVLVDTIHSIKGETVRAVLVLDTFLYSHHFPPLLRLGYLGGDCTNRDPGIRVTDHIKRIFVAMTRPIDLLCLAMCKETLEKKDAESLSKLMELGWRFVDISSES